MWEVMRLERELIEVALMPNGRALKYTLEQVMAPITQPSMLNQTEHEALNHAQTCPI